MSKWPEDFPVHIKVPPLEAEKISEDLYRMVGNTPPNQQDFLATFKDPMQKHLHLKPKNFDKPSFYGTSFFQSSSPLEYVKKSNPNRFRNKNIAVGKILGEHGVAEMSENNHVSVWFYDGVYPQGFKAI